ncbi:MAG: metal-binding protein [Lachnospiraceae bacterium]|nr:metal-binding protein [Lachnospiraceae bacterium]
MNNSYRFFTNKECQYYPFHGNIEEMNCLFCYCPLYHLEPCPGNCEYLEIEGKRIKVCTNCTFPHRFENYEAIMELLKR